MDKSRRGAMDITTVRPIAHRSRRLHFTRKQLVIAAMTLLLIIASGFGIYWYQHRNDQVIMQDHYQVVYLVTGQIYFGKLQNANGPYLTMRNVYTIQNQPSGTGSATDKTTESSKIYKVSQQVYGPDNSIAIRTDQVQFWQNLRTDSKVARLIDSSPAQ